MSREMLAMVATCAVLEAGGACPLQDRAHPVRRDGGARGPHVVHSPTFGKPAKRFVSGCELYLFGAFVEPRVCPGYGTRPGYLIEKTDTDVLVNGVPYFSLLWPPEPEAPASEETKRLHDIYFDTVRELRKHVERTPNGVTFDGRPFRFGQSIVFPREGADSIRVIFRTDMMMLDIKGMMGLVGARYVEPPPLSPAAWARIDSVRLDKMYSVLSRTLKPGRIVLAGRIYLNSYPLRRKEALFEALSRLPEVARVEFVKPNGQPYYEPVTIDGFQFFSPEIADFVRRKGGEGR